MTLELTSHFLFKLPCVTVVPIKVSSELCPSTTYSSNWLSETYLSHSRPQLLLSPEASEVFSSRILSVSIKRSWEIFLYAALKNCDLSIASIITTIQKFLFHPTWPNHFWRHFCHLTFHSHHSELKSTQNRHHDIMTKYIYTKVWKSDKFPMIP